jgi:hypothetical protein
MSFDGWTDFDTWPERLGAGGGLTLALRIGFWLWKRRTGKLPPIIGGLARIAAAESLLQLKSIRLDTALATIARLEAEIEAAGIRHRDSNSDASGAGSFDLPESTLLRSRTRSGRPSASTSAKPDGDLG